MKAILFILAFAACAFAQTPTVTCASGTNRVQEGHTITCTSSSSVTWSLIGGTGSLSGITSTSVTYNAPSSITVNNAMAGCPIMPNDSIFNTRIDNLPLNPNSAAWIAAVVAGDGPSFPVGFGDLGWGTTTSTASTPTRNVNNNYGGATSNFPVSPIRKTQGGINRTQADENDHHILDVATDTCQFFELYNLRAPTESYSTQCNGGPPYNCNAQSSVAYKWSDYTTNNGISGTDAAGLLLAPLTLQLNDFYRGAMNHPLRFTSCIGCISKPSFFWPASAPNGATGINAPPMGAWFRLRLCGVGGASTNCATLSSYSPLQQIVVLGLHNYGMLLADIGSIGDAGTGTDISLDRNVLAAVDSLTLPIGDFEVVDQSSLQYGANSYEVCPYNTNCGFGTVANTFESPNNQAIIVATPTGGGSAVSTSIAIQGVTIGLNAPTLWMEAGSYTYQIPSWVNGTSNQTVNWTEISGPGSVSTSGVYTPPANLPPPLGSPILATNPGVPLEMGVKFKSDSAGYVTGIRWYKVSGQTGTHVGRLWSCGDQTTCATGTQLASATFTETASGWQDVQFSSPVAITANTYYVASYTAPDGSISEVPNGLLSAANNPPLHLPAEGTVGHNGVFAGGVGNFPSSANASEYNWCVDLDFETTLSGPTVSVYGGGNLAILKATSAADSNATAYEYVYILPIGSNPTNSIRIDSGNYSGSTFTDGNGNIWQPEGGLEDASPGCCGADTYPGWQNFLSNPEIGVYETMGYGAGSVNDMEYNFIVPNGNYKVRAMFGAANGATPFGAVLSTSVNAVVPWRLHLETQGDIKLHNFNPLMNGPAGYAWEIRVPTDAIVPAKVTNNTLHIANRGVFYDVDMLANGNCYLCAPSTAIDGLEIIPDTTTPAHWAIDTQQQSTVTAGSALWHVASNGSAFEIGTAFIPTQSGYITGVRFYKTSTDTGTHTGSLWFNQGGPFNGQAGSLLTTGTFTGETASGWQTLLFSSPVAVTAGYQYVISYNSPTGNFYQASNYFTQPLVQPFINGPLEGYMGMYYQGSGTFPLANNTAMFAVDPIFSLASNGSNPVTLFPTIGLPGQQLQFYVQDWYTGVNDPAWSTISGGGTIQAGVDINGYPVGIYTAPWTQPNAGSAVVIKAQSQSTPAISAITTLYFTGNSWRVR